MMGMLLGGVLAMAAPEAVPPTEAEWAKIAAGSVVTRAAPDLDPPGAYGWVEIEASPDAIWATLLDPVVAVEASSAVTACTVYRDETVGEGRLVGLAYELTVAWTDISYSVVRDFRPRQGWMTWSLDPAREHDLRHSSGFYVLTPGRTAGHVLMSYGTQTDSGRRIPAPIQQFLTGKALKNYLGNIQRAAEEA